MKNTRIFTHFILLVNDVLNVFYFRFERTENDESGTILSPVVYDRTHPLPRSKGCLASAAASAFATDVKHDKTCGGGGCAACCQITPDTSLLFSS